jgi:dTDP-4-amino-4,6-dideoxygalactose transaminase
VFLIEFLIYIITTINQMVYGGSKMINVTKTYLPNVKKYKEYVDKIFESGWITNNGQMVQELEKRLREYLGVKNIILVSNGTLALQVAYKLLNLEGEVITTPFSFAATTSSMVWEGLKPVFADINSDTFCLDHTKIVERITDKTTAIVPVHVFGNGCEVEEIEKIARKYDLKVIYDAAHAFGVEYSGSSILNYGDVSILSFHATKIFHTIEGGALIIKEDKLYERAKRLINFGITGPENINGIGINAKMNEFQAAMGLCVLDDIDETLVKRKTVYETYIKELKDNKDIKLQMHNQECNYNYGYFPILLNSEEILHDIKSKLEEQDIYPRRYFYPSLDTLDYVESSYMKNSNDISKRILCLPISSSLPESDICRIVSCLKT